MLEVKRSDVACYLKVLGQEFRNDSSNSSSRFTRNWLRNELLPMIRERLNPGVDAALYALSKQADEMQHSLVRTHKSAACKKLQRLR